VHPLRGAHADRVPVHAALTESLFVCLAVAVFDHAERGQWLLAGSLGFFPALTRSIGFLAVIALAAAAARAGLPPRRPDCGRLPARGLAAAATAVRVRRVPMAQR
jgi:hypothetical protein